MQYCDDITCEPLPADLAKAAQQEELGFINDWKLLDVARIAEWWARSGKAQLKVKWVDANKVDLTRLVIRCKLVGNALATYKAAEFFCSNVTS